LKRFISQLGIARPKDMIVTKICTKLLLEGLLDINLSNDAETFAFESVSRLPNGLIEPKWQDYTEIVLHCGFSGMMKGDTT
jgi:hypothetical protein